MFNCEVFFSRRTVAPPEGLRLYAEAEGAYWAHQKEFRSSGFGNQLLRDDPCIPSNELVPALLCEDPDSVAAFWETLPDGNRPGIDKWIADCIHDAVQEGFEIGSPRTIIGYGLAAFARCYLTTFNTLGRTACPHTKSIFKKQLGPTRNIRRSSIISTAKSS